MLSAAGVTYDDRTPKNVMDILECARIGGKRVRLYYGDAYTGKDWHEEHDVCGTLSTSTGPVRVPILLANNHSRGGGHILDHCIVKIKHGQRVLWQHAKYFHGVFSKHTCNFTAPNGKTFTVQVRVNGKEHAAFETEVQADRWIAKMS
jgi:hypothetical protein